MRNSPESPSAGRRRFLTVTGAAGAGVILPATLQSAVAHAEQGGWIRSSAGYPEPAASTRIANILDFGAVGDGSTDDTAAFAAAIAALPEGGQVLVPTGSYSVSQIRLKRRINLVGQGWRSVIIQRTNVGGSLIVLDDTSVEFTRVASLTLNGNKQYQNSANHAIDYDNNGGTFSFYDACHVIDNVLVYGPKGHGIRLSLNSRETRLNDVYVTAADGSAYSVEATDCYFVNCAAAGSGLSGWNVIGPNNKFSNCKAFGNGRFGTVSNCSGFALRQARQVLSTCEAQDNGGSGFLIDRQSDMTLDACVADSNGTLGPNYSGFEVVDGTKITLIGFQSMNRSGKVFQQFGLSVSDSTTGFTAIGICHDNVQGDLKGAVRGRSITINSVLLRYALPAAPAEGTGTLGEVVLSTNPGANSPIGWICVAAGTPGTWAPLGTGNGVHSAVLPPSNGSNDTAAINAALVAHAGQLITGLPGEKYLITAPLVIGSGTTLDMSTCSVTLKSGSHSCLITNRAADTVARTLTGMSMTQGSPVLTGDSAAFSIADVGRTVVVPSAGGADGPLSAVIESVNSPTSATLTTAAVVSVSDRTVPAYDRDSAIRIRGGVWERAANNNGQGRNLHAFAFRRCDDLKILGVTCLTSSGKYAINLGDVSESLISNVRLKTFSDGVHLNGPISNVTITRVSGTTGGDGISLTARDYPTYNDTQGLITGVTIEGIGITTSSTLIKVLGGTGAGLGTIAVNNVVGSASRGIGVIDDQVGSTVVADLSIDGLNVTLTGATSSSAIDLSATGGGLVSVRRLRFTASVMTFGIILGNWDQATVRDLTSVAAAGASSVMIRASGVVGRISAANIRASYSDTNSSSLIDIASSGDVGSMSIDDVIQTGGRCLFSLVGKLPRVSVTNASVSGASRFANLATTVDLSMTDVALDRLANAAIYVSGTAEVLLRGNDIRRASDPSGLQKQGTQSVRCTNPDFPANIALLGLAVGDTAFNTNAALSCGVGPVLCDGSRWKNLYSQATY